MRGIVRRRRRLFGSLVLAGLALGLTASLVWPPHFRADLEVVIPRIDDSEGLEATLEREAQFVNAEVVRSAVRAVLPNAPDRIDVEIDDDRQILRLEAAADTPDDALRLARTWATAFVEQRQISMTSALAQRNDVIEQQLEQFAEQISAARQLGNDGEVERLETQRDAAAGDRVRVLDELAAVQQDATAAVVDQGELPTKRRGVRPTPALALGATLGAVAATVIAGWLDRASQQSDEADRWLGADDHVGDALAESAPLVVEPPAGTTTPLTAGPPAGTTGRRIDDSPARTTSTATEPPGERAAVPRVPAGRLRRPGDDGRIRFPAHRLDQPLRIVTIPAGRDGC